MSHADNVTIRPATIDDRPDIYTWLAASDVTSSMMGPPTFPDVPIPSWEEFCADYASHFFDGSRPDRARSFIIDVNGESVGHINYDGLDSKQGIAELDIWMRSTSYCGRGFGAKALCALMKRLNDHFNVRKYIMRPSLRNQRAVRAYENAGFHKSRLSHEEQNRIYGSGDYSDTITLERESSA